MTPCKHIETATPDHSPLNRMLVTGYYDGPTEGFVECRECGQTYAFRKLAWDDEQDVRIFGLAPLDERLDQIREDVLKLAQGGDVVRVVPLAGDGAQPALDRLAASPIRYVVASLDLRKGLLAQRALAPDDMGDRNWFEWLGI